MASAKVRLSAYSESDDLYSFKSALNFQFHDASGNLIGSYTANPDTTNGKYYLDNPKLTNVSYVQIWCTTNQVFPIVDANDYYLLGSCLSYLNGTTDAGFTWKPQSIVPHYLDVASSTYKVYSCGNLNVYNLDNYYLKGFGFYESIDFVSSDNGAICNMYIGKDKDGTGTVEANLIWDFAIMAVNKSTDEATTLNKILTQLQTMQSQITSSISSSTNQITDSVNQQGEAIQGSIDSASQDIQDKINSQYDISDSEDFGIDGLQQTVEDKMGVLAFASNTTSDLLNLFKGNSSRASYSTTITFPSFNLKVQGKTYKIWDEYQYDFSELEVQVPTLVNGIRTFSVLAVWFALLNYLIDVYKHFIGGE